MADVIALLAERREEIKAIGKLYRELSKSLGGETASHVLCEAIAAEAHASGKRAAPRDVGEACLGHFASAFNGRGADGGIEGRCHMTEDGKLIFEIDRCDYHALYHSSDLPPAISDALSCGREEPFAKGYDPRIALDSRAEPSGENHSCRMVFSWNPVAIDKEEKPRTTLKVRDN